MREPTVRTSRLAIAGGFAAALLLGGVGFLVGRTTVSPVAAPAPAAPPPTAPAPAPAEGGRTLGRAEIVGLARDAADAFAAGAVSGPALADLLGRRFVVSLPFGCAGPAGADSPTPLRWRYDDRTQTLRIQLALIGWQPEEWGLNASADGPPRGFWIARPWSLAETCPVASGTARETGIEPVTLPGQTLALVAFGQAPTGAGGPYEAVIRTPHDRLNLTQGLRARIAGRIDRVPGDGPVRCVQPAGIDQQPVCAVASLFDELVVDNPATGETLATWNLGRIGEGTAEGLGG